MLYIVPIANFILYIMKVLPSFLIDLVFAGVYILVFPGAFAFFFLFVTSYSTFCKFIGCVVRDCMDIVCLFSKSLKLECAN